MPRLPEPTLTLRSSRGKLIDPRPHAVTIPGYTAYHLAAPVHETPGRTVPAPVPAGYVGVDAVADALGLPPALVRRWATTSPDRLPAFQLIDGQPVFDPAALAESAVAR